MNRDEVLDIVESARKKGETPDLQGADLQGVDLQVVDLEDEVTSFILYPL